MASSLKPIIQTYKAGGTIVEGHAVKISSSDDQKVVECTASTDKSIGVAQGSASSNQMVEVALPGGGCKYVAQTTIAAGKGLVSHSDGTLKPISGANDRVIVVAMVAAAAGDIAAGVVQIFQATATES